MSAPHGAPGVHSVIGVDAGTASLREADHLIHDLVTRLGLPQGTLACTHLIRTDERRGTAVSFALPDARTAAITWSHVVAPADPGMGAALAGRSYGAEPAAHAAMLAAEEHAHRRGGRAVLFPGVDHLTGTVRLTYDLGAVDRPVYVRLRGTDGNRSAVGLRGASVDPAGPAVDVIGDADPWKDLWFYSNPVWVLPS
jgi:hypothetical protein